MKAKAVPGGPAGSPSPSGPETFDCFLSHNSKAKKAVRALAEVLRSKGIKVWLDEEQLRPGTSSQAGLEAGILASHSVAVLVGEDGLGPWEQEEQEAAISLAVRDRRPVIPVLLADAPDAPDLPLLLRNRTWVDLRAQPDSGTAAGIDRLVWGITGHKGDARRPRRKTSTKVAPRHGTADAATLDARPGGQRANAAPMPLSAPGAHSQPPTAIHRKAKAAIAGALDLVPALCAALAKQPVGGGAATAAAIAAGLCAAQGGFLIALNSLVSALPEAGGHLRQRGEDRADLRRRALDILGWMVVTTVLDGYDCEDAAPIRTWWQGSAFHIPLGRSPCVEVLTARWRGGKAEFSTEPRRFDYGRDDITPERFGEIGFDDPRRLDSDRAVDYVWRRVYQDVYGQPAPASLPPAKVRDLRAWLDRELAKGRRLRLVIDRYDLDEAFALPTTLAAIGEAIPQIQLIVIDSGATDDPGVFVVPASDLAAGIYDCLKTIEALA